MVNSHGPCHHGASSRKHCQTKLHTYHLWWGLWRRHGRYSDRGFTYKETLSTEHREMLSQVVTFELKNEKIQMECLLRHLKKFQGKTKLVGSLMNHDETGDGGQRPTRRQPWTTARSLEFILPTCWGKKANGWIDLPLVFASVWNGQEDRTPKRTTNRVMHHEAMNGLRRNKLCCRGRGDQRPQWGFTAWVAMERKWNSIKGRKLGC